MRTHLTAGLMLLGVVASHAPGQSRSFTTVQRGTTIASEKYTQSGDTIVSEFSMGGGAITVKSRLQKHGDVARVLDAEALAGGETQHIHIEMGDTTARVHYDGRSFAVDTVLALPRDKPVVMYYNLAFSMLQPLAALRPKPGAGPRQVGIMLVQNARIETWTLQAISADSVQVTTTRGLQLLLTFSGDTLVGVDVASQDLSARSVLAGPAPAPGKPE